MIEYFGVVKDKPDPTENSIARPNSPHSVGS